MDYRIIEGDCIEGMRRLEGQSVNCVVTSPPYFGLRDYGHDGQIGLEASPDAYVATKPYKGAHFATFPPDLIRPCILAGCPKDGTVLDPFGGSGTTALVALEEGRKAVLCELNADYIALAHKRLEGLQLRIA